MHAESAIKLFRGILGASEKDYQETFEAGIKKDLESKIRAGLKDVATSSEELIERQKECAKEAEEELNKANKMSEKETKLIEEEEEEKCESLVQSSRTYSSESAKAKRN